MYQCDKCGYTPLPPRNCAKCGGDACMSRKPGVWEQRYLEALQEIAKGEGPYSRNPLVFAQDTLLKMINIARGALRLKPVEDLNEDRRLPEGDDGEG